MENLHIWISKDPITDKKKKKTEYIMARNKELDLMETYFKHISVSNLDVLYWTPQKFHWTNTVFHI